jgi:putative PEP-CTERM system histidine kinase
MSIDTNVVLALVAAACLLAVGILSVFRERASLVRTSFVVGMFVLAADTVLAARAMHCQGSDASFFWVRLRFVSACLVPGTWLVFAVAYGRANSGAFLRQWRYALATLFLLPLACVLLFPGQLIRQVASVRPTAGELPMGWSGTAATVICLFGIVLVLMNLEKTLRASTGTMRWRIKFMIIALVVIFGTRIYELAHALLYASVILPLTGVTSAAAIVACILAAVSLLRSDLAQVDLYLSGAFLFRSFTVLILVLYLLSVGLMAKIAEMFGGSTSFPFKTLLLFLAFMFLGLVCLSDRLRQRAKRLVSRHFHRPQYDHRKVWTTFSELTARTADRRQYCQATVDAISRIFDVLSATLWVLDEKAGRLDAGGSTSLPTSETHDAAATVAADAACIRRLATLEHPVDIDASMELWATPLREGNPACFSRGGHRVCVPLAAGNRAMGALVLGDRVSGLSYSIAELELLQAIGGHVGAALLNMQLSQSLLEAKQMEAFQAMSAFFVHDLKNTAATLSLTLQNLPKHFENPSFRDDALASIAKGVAGIEDLIRRLTLLREKLDIHPAPTDLNAVIRDIVSGLGDAVHSRVATELAELPTIGADAEQLRKVLTNLLLNADQATSGRGEITVRTACDNGRILLSVVDNGSGMSDAFIANSLFRPFQSTKKDGMGIGLFQSKMIVEAHGGRIDVRSEEGKGTTFDVVLPVNGD